VYFPHRRLPPGHDFVSSSCCWPHRPSSGRRSVRCRRHERPLRAFTRMIQITPLMHATSTKGAERRLRLRQAGATPNAAEHHHRAVIHRRHSLGPTRRRCKPTLLSSALIQLSLS
jgi:hypothetical protein